METIFAYNIQGTQFEQFYELIVCRFIAICKNYENCVPQKLDIIIW